MLYKYTHYPPHAEKLLIHYKNTLYLYQEKISRFDWLERVQH